MEMNDYISRAEVLKLMQDNWHTHNGDWAMQESIDDIRALPSVTPQEKKGHWIPVFQGDEIIDYRCSCCEFGNTFGKGTIGMNYCPRCGSRNEVEE